MNVAQGFCPSTGMLSDKHPHRVCVHLHAQAADAKGTQPIPSMSLSQTVYER